MAMILFILSFPDFFAGNDQVKAAGDPNYIEYIDIYVEGFTEYNPRQSYMGNISDVTLISPGFTLKNVRMNKTTRNIEYNIVPDGLFEIKSGNYADWGYDTGRIREVNVSVGYNNNGHQRTIRSTRWNVIQFPSVYTENTMKIDLNKTPSNDYVPGGWDYELPQSIEIIVEGSDGHSDGVGNVVNGWENTAVKYITKPLIINSAPSITVTTPSEQQLMNVPGFNLLNIEGYVRDVDNNDLVVSAEIPNLFYKKTTVPQALNNKPFSIPLDVIGDGIPPGRHVITVKVVDPYHFKAEASLVINVSQRLRNKSFVLINTPTQITTSYKDYEGDPKHQERYRYDHDPYFFENSMGIIGDSGLWRTEQYTSFPYSGVYTATFQARDNPRNDDRFDEYRMWSRDNLSSMTYHVHRKPIALFAAKLTGGGLQLTDFSYDLDHVSAVNKGLMDWQWQYKAAEAEIWTDGYPPGQLPTTGPYEIRLRVRDVDGENSIGVWSDWAQQSVGAGGNLPPVARFTVNPNIVSYRKATTITDKSFDPDNDPLDIYEWSVVKDGWNTVWSHYGGATTPPNIAAYGVGNYHLTLKVRDNKGLWSEPYSQIVQVMNHPPAAAFYMPPEVYRDTVITMENLTPDPDEDGDGLSYGWNARLNNSPYYYSGGNRNQVMTVRDLIAKSGISQQQAISEGWEMRLTASDGSLSSNATRLFTVKNHIPTAAINGPDQIYQYDSHTYYGVDADDDPSDMSSLQYYWKVTDSDGTTKMYRTPNITTSFPEVGTYTLEHWVYDQIGAKSNVAVLKVIVKENLAPAMVLTAPLGTKDNPSIFDAEKEGDPLIQWTYSDPENDPQEKYRLEFFNKEGILAKTVENSDANGSTRQYQIPNPTFERFELFSLYGKAYSKGSWSDASNEKAFIIDNPPKPGFTLLTDTGKDATKTPIYRTDMLNIKSTATDPDELKGDTLSYKYTLKPAAGTEGLVSTQKDFTKQFATNGTFTYRQVVTDSLGLFREISHSIAVINRLPTVSITYPTSDSQAKPTIVSTLTPIIKWTYQDEDGDLQQRYRVRIISLATGAIKVQSGEQASSAKQWQVPSGTLLENEKYAIEVEVFDGFDWSAPSPRKYMMVNLLSVKGGVKHTMEWDNNRKAYNLKKSGDENGPRGYNVFWAGERFVFLADTTGLPDTVEVTMPGGYSVQLTATDADKVVWTGELYDASFQKLPDGPLTFTFTAANEYQTKTDKVTVVISGDWSEYFQNHRIQ
ncbi:hypothetical protein J7E73_24985 [Paenibacillus albidus]|uniref:glycoside hydrolase family 78 protein n=1 Tax=Paenibacillus albidus TaxID=2041023 RepID=UPI001BE5B4A0|nr:hypothetical protein [Paenibacillus albidus]MBT2292324.1 hypothetical protein [Paenibacillus albidus]